MTFFRVITDAGVVNRAFGLHYERPEFARLEGKEDMGVTTTEICFFVLVRKGGYMLKYNNDFLGRTIF
jgi:hypothetical protein